MTSMVASVGPDGPIVLTRDGLMLATEHHIVADAKAHILFVHGFGEHKGRYGHVVAALTRAGYACHLFDLRGHGISQGVRGYVTDFTDFHDDLGRVVSQVRHSMVEGAPRGRNRPPLVALAHSMGGLIALDHVIRYPDTFDAMILSSPFLAEAFKIHRFERMVGGLLARILPALRLSSRIDARLLSHDDVVVKAYVHDPHVLSHITPRLWREIGIAQREVSLYASQVKLPALFLVGGADHVVDPTATIAVFRDLGSEDKQLLTYDGYFHEVLNEVGSGRVVDNVCRWMDDRWARRRD